MLSEKILKEIADNGGQAIYVGGYVRDRFMGIESRDLDVEVYGIPAEDLPHVLEKVIGKPVKQLSVGEHDFPVWLCDGVEFAMPRTEEPTDKGGYTDFIAKPDHKLDFETAAMRRDYTINAIGYDPLTDRYIDPYDGMVDIERKILKATSEKFTECALRVLRGFQFCSRFNLTPTADTIEKCKGMIDRYPKLSKERVWKEFCKWATGNYPKAGLGFLQKTKWINLFPIIFNQHILSGEVCSRLVGNTKFSDNDRWRTPLMLASLLYCSSPDQAFRFLITDLGSDIDTAKDVAELLSNKLAHIGCTPASVRRIIHKENKRKSFRVLPHLMRAIAGYQEDISDFCVWGQREFTANPELKRYVTGNDLMKAGYKPSIELGHELNRLYDLQLDCGYNRETLLKEIKSAN